MATTFFAWNVRNTRKNTCVGSWITTSNASFGCLLETRVQAENCSSILNRVAPGWSSETNYEFNSLGRIWFLWRSSMNVTILYKSAQLITAGVITEKGEKLVVSCVYASNFRRDRVCLWDEIRNHKTQLAVSANPWILVGDFNEILASNEHSKSVSNLANQMGMCEFQDLTIDCELSDLVQVGNTYTWRNNQSENPISKKLDRALVSPNWRLEFPHSKAIFASNGVSDHSRCVIHLSDEVPTKKRYHFQYFNYLSEHPQFLDTIASAWNTSAPLFHSRAALSIFHKKLKRLKPLLQTLNRERYGNISEKTKIAFDLLCHKQDEALMNPITETFDEVRRASENWNHLASIEEKFFRQKSRIHWLKHGDQNTAFFHRSTQARNSKNGIRQIIKSDGTELTTTAEISAEAVAHFEKFLNDTSQQTDGVNEEWLQGLLNFRCSQDSAGILVKQVTGEEVKQVLFSMPSNKAPGPDGFTMEFFRDAWSVVGKDMIVAIQSFFENAILPSGVNATALTLIPKSENAERIKDYRPIACCNLVYKVISKILANRLKQILPESMVLNQSAFIKGRLLLENVLLATELVKDYHKTSIAPRCALKLDISKAFDSVRWDFILATLRTMGLPLLFVNWIRSCISTAAFSVQINGELSGFFTSARGLRQGCALSPYLFVIAMNVLSLMLNRAATNRLLGHHPYCEDLNITHLSFADDMLVFTDGSECSLRRTIGVLNDFAAVSGLGINPQKSVLFSGGKVSLELSRAATEYGIPEGKLPIRYLGIPLTTKTMTKTDYEPLIDRIRRRMTMWTNKSLSYAGRLQLIKAVIASITNFWSSVFRLPKRCFDKIESMCSAFLWSGSPNVTTKAKVSWAEVCTPKSEGGLGIRRLADSAKVFALRLIWRLFENTDSLWVSWTKRYLIRQSSFWDISSSTRGSWIWQKLLKLRSIAKNFLRAELGDGRATSFWFDCWLPIGRLIDIVEPIGMQAFGVQRTAVVADVCSQNEWRLRRGRGPGVQEVMNAIRAHPTPKLTAGHDCHLWRHGLDEYKASFSSIKTWEQIRSTKQKVPWHTVVWFSQGIPSRSFITWLALHNKLSTGDRMRAWGVNQVCSFCGDGNETRNHLFFECTFSFTVWFDVCGRLLQTTPVPDWNCTLRAIQRNPCGREDYILRRLALQSTIYNVWRERNNRCHQQKGTTAQQLAQHISKEIMARILSLKHSGDEQDTKLKDRWNETRNNVARR